MKHPSVIKLSKSALENNIKYLQKRIGKSVKFVSVIKSNAYGHGIKEFLPIAEACGIDYFAVFDSCEAEIAYNVKKPETKIMIMGMIADEDILWAIKNDISFFVFENKRLKQAIKDAKKLGKKAKIHLEIETGLHRSGYEIDELIKAVKLIKQNKSSLFIEGICTHYAGTESIANYVRIKNQIKRFHEVKKWLKERKIVPKYYHTANSAAAFVYPETCMDMVRMGIVQYGFWPSEEVRIHNTLTSKDKNFEHRALKRVLKWESQIMSIEHVEPGEFISYGNFFQATKKTKIATVPVGYSQGYRRSLSNLGWVLVKGKKAPVIGMVNMSVMIINVTSIPLAKKGDTVVLIGKQGKHEITVASFSEISNLVNYEVLTRLPERIPRIIKK
jgi:alanine racemase